MALPLTSSSGFTSFRRGVNLNAWLLREGYLTLNADADGGSEWLCDVDWSSTRASCLGLAGIFLNMQGRERQGVVAPGEEAARLKAEIWQITPETSGRFDLVVGMGSQRVLKRVEVSEAIIRRAPSRIEQAWLADLFDPADQRLPSGGVMHSVDIQYPRREMSVSGWRVHRLVLFAVSSMIFVLVLKRPLRVAL
jgi:hypothetical protein